MGIVDARGVLRILIVSDDVGYRRFAAVGLDRAGHSVRTTTLNPARLMRMLAGAPTDVVVLDCDALADDLWDAVTSSHPTVGIVQLQEEGKLGVTKWGPLAALVAEVQIVAEQVTARKPERHLRIV